MREIAQTVDYALLTLMATGANGPQSIRDIHDRLGVSIASARRTVVTLHREGLLRRREDGRYDIGPRMIRLTEPLLDKYAELADEHMRSLAAYSGRTVLLSAFRADSVFVLHQTDPDQGGLRIDYRSSQSRALGDDADGLVILAHLNEARRIRFLRDSPIAGGSGRLARIRDEGYLVQQHRAWGEPLGASVPIFDEEIGVIGSLTMVGEAEHGFEVSELVALRRAATLVGQGYGAPSLSADRTAESDTRR